MKRKFSEVEIDEMWRTKRVKLPLGELLTHFTAVIYGLGVGLFMLFLIDHLWQLVVAVGFISFGVYAWFRQKRELDFVEVKISETDKDLESVIGNVGKKMQWWFYCKADKVIIAEKITSKYLGSYDERITILFNDDLILINFISNPDSRPSFTSRKRKVQIIETIIQELQNDIQSK